MYLVLVVDPCPIHRPVVKHGGKTGVARRFQGAVCARYVALVLADDKVIRLTPANREALAANCNRVVRIAKAQEAPRWLRHGSGCAPHHHKDDEVGSSITASSLKLEADDDGKVGQS